MGYLANLTKALKSSNQNEEGLKNLSSNLDKSPKILKNTVQQDEESSKRLSNVIEKPSVKSSKSISQNEDWLKKISNIFKKYVFRNFGWKLFSFFCATALWSIVINYEYPIASHQFSPFLQVRGVEQLEKAGVALLNQSLLSSSTIGVEILSRDNVNITSDQITVYIDLEDLEELEDITSLTTITVPVSYEVNTAFSPTEFAVNVLREVELRLDRIKTVSFPITINKEGELPPGLDMEEVIVSPQHIYVTGATNELENIHSILVTLNSEEITEDYADFYNFTIVNEQGINITNRFSFSPESIFLSFGLTRSVVVPVGLPTIVGNPAQGFTRGTFNVSKSSITIYGKPILVSDIAEVNLGEINISGLTEATTFYVDLRTQLPEGVNVFGESLVTVSININPSPILVNPIVGSQIIDDDYQNDFNEELEELEEPLPEENIENEALEVVEDEPELEEPILELEELDQNDDNGDSEDEEELT
ncbi:MAG: CdaR family protein [Defluviitaleaceae bacterium]|nr:CdaR family protein [Defluviitaleaceae bacterium]